MIQHGDGWETQYAHLRRGSVADVTVFDPTAEWQVNSAKFRTKGRFAAASIRGTTWDTVDRCDGTLVKVTQGKVSVIDLERHKNILVKKGKSYLS